MHSDFKKIIAIFKNINKKGYFKGITNNVINSCGLTFENLINKKADSKYLPDFDSVEIKTTHRFSRYDINLFSLKFDGPDQYESNYLLTTYGIKNKDFDKKELTVNLKFREKVLVNDKYFFELNIDYMNKMFCINIFDLNQKFLETRGYLNFDSINKRINIKLKNLALIHASKKIINSNLYFRYYKISCYQYKGIETFLELIQNGDVNLTLMLRFAKSGVDIGKNKNKNIIFSISKLKINKLYNEIYTYED